MSGEETLGGALFPPSAVTITTIDHGPVTVAEPSWCIGHHWQRDIGRSDICHRSVRVKSGVDLDARGRLPLLTAHVSWAPFRELVPVVTLLLDVEGDFAAEDSLRVAEGLRLAAARLEQVAAEAIRLRGEAS